MTAARHNEGKPRLAQLHHFELEGLAAHCDRGREKYPDTEDGRPNWLLGQKPKEEYLDAIERHVRRIVKYDEVYDLETGTRHIDAIAWNALAAGTVATDYVYLPLTVDLDEPTPEPVVETSRGRRVSYEGRPGRLVWNGDQFWFYADDGPKILVLDPDAAHTAGALVYEETTAPAEEGHE